MARYIAGRLGSRTIETEHLLLALLSTDKLLARRFFGSPWVAEEILKSVEQSRTSQEPVQGLVELPLTGASKRVLAFAAVEADSFATRKIGTKHLLLGLLQEQEGLAAEILLKRGIHVTDVRQKLRAGPHDDSAIEKFERERIAYPEEVIDLRDRVREIRAHMEEAIAQNDFAKAKAYSDEEGRESEKLFSAYRRRSG